MFESANVTLVVSNFENSLSFFTEKLGLVVVYRHQDEWAELGGPGITIGLTPAKEREEAKNPLSPAIALNVIDLETAMTSLSARGISFQGPVREEKNARLAFFEDPDRHPFYLCQVRSHF